MVFLSARKEWRNTGIGDNGKPSERRKPDGSEMTMKTERPKHYKEGNMGKMSPKHLLIVLGLNLGGSNLVI